MEKNAQNKTKWKVKSNLLEDIYSEVRKLGMQIGRIDTITSWLGVITSNGTLWMSLSF